MLKDLEFTNLEVVSCTKNITDIGDEKYVNITVNLVKESDSFAHLEGIELLVHKTNLENENKFIKLSCTYSLNESGQTVLPIKIAYNGSTEKYSQRAFYDYQLTPTLFEDIAFVEAFFERAPDELKRLYM